MHGAGFGALLWASPDTQAARFDAIRRIVNLSGKSVLDVGCGRADLLEYLHGHGVHPSDYVGLEAIDALANASAAKHLPRATIVLADFVADPGRLLVGADVVILSGSLNTAGDSVFYPTLNRAFKAAGVALVFNFLCSERLAGKNYLHWRAPNDVLRFARGLSKDVRILDDYLPGDMTVRISRSDARVALG
jgi:hypothetical protein